MVGFYKPGIGTKHSPEIGFAVDEKYGALFLAKPP